MMHDKFVRAQHRRSGLKEAAQMIREKYVITDGSMKDQLICDDAPYGDRFVSQEAWIDILGMLSQLEDVETEYLQKHEIRLKDDTDIPSNLKDHYKNGTEQKKRRRRKKDGGGNSAPPSSSPAT